jgi:hypothetical protein
MIAPEEVCMSYANMDAVPTQTAGTSELLATDWNTYVRDNFDSIKFGHVVCTSSTRPTGIAEGTMIYETDTNKVLVYDGSGWVEVSDLDSTGAISTDLFTVMKNVQSAAKTSVASTTSQTYSDISGLSVTITPTFSSSKILIFGDIQGSSDDVGDGVCHIRLLRGATAIHVGDASGSTTQTSASFSGRVMNINPAYTGAFHVLDSPATTSATTYKLQFRMGTAGNVGSAYVNRSQYEGGSTGARGVSTITAMEVLA